MIDEVLADGVLADSLELEITESVAVQNIGWSSAVLNDINMRGVRLAVDDFGTGQSSLIYLKRLPIHIIKIDRAFIHDLISDADDAAIVSSVIQLAHSLGLEVVAEGIETQEQFNFLRRARCDRAQGYLLSEPLAAEEALEFAKNFKV